MLVFQNLFIPFRNTMKTILTLSLLFLATSFLQAQTILIDYAGRTGSSVTLLDGDFGNTATNFGSTVTVWDPVPPLADFQINTNLHSGVGTNANAVIGQANDGTPLDFGINTGYTLKEGDSFDLTYMWRDAANWDDGADQVTVELFYTNDNSFTGTRTNVLTLTSGLSLASNSWQSESILGASGNNLSGIDAQNKTLFLAVTTTADQGEFARFDNVYLRAIPVPEPSVAGMVLGGLGLLSMARRQRGNRRN